MAILLPRGDQTGSKQPNVVGSEKGPPQGTRSEARRGAIKSVTAFDWFDPSRAQCNRLACARFA
jgi:hypothetical protein